MLLFKQFVNIFFMAESVTNEGVEQYRLQKGN